MLTSSTSQDRTRVGDCNAKLIRRSRIRDTFYDVMDEPSTETSQLAFNLFDRYGRLRREFKEHEIKKGSGIWQDELDFGDLLLIETLKVEKLYRRRGLGRKLVNALLETARLKSQRFFVIIYNGWLAREVEKEAGCLKGE